MGCYELRKIVRVVENLARGWLDIADFPTKSNPPERPRRHAQTLGSFGFGEKFDHG